MGPTHRNRRHPRCKRFFILLAGVGDCYAVVFAQVSAFCCVVWSAECWAIVCRPCAPCAHHKITSAELHAPISTTASQIASNHVALLPGIYPWDGVQDHVEVGIAGLVAEDMCQAALWHAVVPWCRVRRCFENGTHVVQPCCVEVGSLRRDHPAVRRRAIAWTSRVEGSQRFTVHRVRLPAVSGCAFFHQRVVHFSFTDIGFPPLAWPLVPDDTPGRPGIADHPISGRRFRLDPMLARTNCGRPPGR